MTYEEYAKLAKKAGGGLPSKERAFNDSRHIALKQAAEAIGIKLEVLEAMIKGRTECE